MAGEPEWAQRAFDRQDALQHELLKASLDCSKEAIRAALLLNGATCIAILGYLASVLAGDATNHTDPSVLAAKAGLKWFSVGALLAAATSGVAYLCNSYYGNAAAAATRSNEHPYIRDNDRSVGHHQRGRWLNVAGVILIMASYGLFVIGLFIIGTKI